MNLLKSKVIMVSFKTYYFFLYKNQALEHIKSYKYIGINFFQTFSCALCVVKRVEVGYKVLYSLLNHCRQVYLQVWDLKKLLFKILVFFVILYDVQIWSVGIKNRDWKKIEKVQKLFLKIELGVRYQTPYDMLFAECDYLYLEVEALYLAIIYISKMKSLGDTRLSYQALRATISFG